MKEYLVASKFKKKNWLLQPLNKDYDQRCQIFFFYKNFIFVKKELLYTRKIFTNSTSTKPLSIVAFFCPQLM